MRRRKFDMNEPPSEDRSIRLSGITQQWPLVLAAMLITVGAAFWSHAQQTATYSAVTRIVVVPLSQWDETFIGTDLVRDSGDATRTALTSAAELKSDHYAAVAARRLGGAWTPQSISAAVTVNAPGETNIIEVTARSSDPDTAQKLASDFATAAMEDRWQIISAQLDARIAALRQGSLSAAGDQQGANPSAAEIAGRLQTLTVVRDSGTDPTLRIGSTSQAVRVMAPPLVMTLVLAALGGLVIGVLAAAIMELLRSSPMRLSRPAGRLISRPLAYAPNGIANADAKSR